MNLDAFTTIDEKLQKLIDLKERKAIYVTYPIEGKKNLSVGTTIINFDTGNVYLPSGTERTDRTSATVPEPLRSIFIWVESTAKITVKHGSTKVLDSDILPGSTKLKNIYFDRLEVKAYKETLFWCLASTDPEGAFIDLSDYYEGKPYIAKGTLTVGTPVEIDIRTNLGRNARSGYLGNMGDPPVTAGAIKVWEDDGTGYTTTYYIIEPHGMVPCGSIM